MYAIGEQVQGWRPADVPDHPKCQGPGCKRYIPDDKLSNITKYCSTRCCHRAQRVRKAEKDKQNGA